MENFTKKGAYVLFYRKINSEMEEEQEDVKEQKEEENIENVHGLESEKEDIETAAACKESNEMIEENMNLHNGDMESKLDDPRDDVENDKNTPNTGNKVTTKKEYCVCKEPYDKTRSMVRCDCCKKWFHGECCSLWECDKCWKQRGHKIDEEMRETTDGFKDREQKLRDEITQMKSQERKKKVEVTNQKYNDWKKN